MLSYLSNYQTIHAILSISLTHILPFFLTSSYPQCPHQQFSHCSYFSIPYFLVLTFCQGHIHLSTRIFSYTHTYLSDMGTQVFSEHLCLFDKHIFPCTHIHKHFLIYTHIPPRHGNIGVLIKTHIFIYTYPRTSFHIDTHTWEHKRSHTKKWSHLHIYTYPHDPLIYTHIPTRHGNTGVLQTHILIYTLYTRIFSYTHTYLLAWSHRRSDTKTYSYIHIFSYTHIRTHLFIYTHIPASHEAYVFAYKHMFSFTPIHISAYIFSYAHSYLPVMGAYVLIQTHVLTRHIHTHLLIHTHIPARHRNICLRIQTHVLIYTYTHIRTHLLIYTHIPVSMGTQAFWYKDIFLYTHILIYTYSHIHISAHMFSYAHTYLPDIGA